MLKLMKKIPAGTLIVPMLLSALINTFWSGLFQMGGITEGFLGGQGNNFIMGMLTFVSGLGIDLRKSKDILKHHGVLILVKLILSVGLSFLYIYLFGQEGTLGMSALAFTVIIVSVNSSLYISLSDDYGSELDRAAFAFVGLFSIPVIPVMIYSVGGAGNIDWLPILSTLVPLILGIVIGAVEPGFKEFFSGAIGILLPFLGWSMGQSMNLIDGFKAGFSGILLTILFYIFTSVLVLVDRYVLKNSGTTAMSMNAVAPASTSIPTIVAQSNPALQPFVPAAIAQVLMACIITIFVTPIIVQKLDKAGAPE